MLMTKFSWRVSAGAKAGAAAVLALGLFASSPYTNDARAIDLSPTISNAALVFSIAILENDQAGQLCAHNYNTVNVDIIFVHGISNGFSESDTPEGPVTIEPNRSSCTNISTDQLAVSARPAIVFKSPIECSQATEYPGKCRVVASFEILESPGNASSPIRHLEPVLLPAIPGNPRINPVTLPQ
jgi:hypothetical protein